MPPDEGKTSAMRGKPARRPILVVLAGPNGAGKSTLSPQVQIGPKIDPDFIARSINPTNVEAAGLAAARETFRQLAHDKEQCRSFTWETTLSSNHSLREIADAQRLGYEAHLYFAALDAADQSAERVQQRIVLGGHNIDPATLARRFDVIFGNVVEIAPTVDRFTLIDNHQGDTETVLSIESGRVTSRATSKSARITALIDAIVASAS